MAPSARNPDGLGLIEDDSPKFMPEAPRMTQLPAKRGEGKAPLSVDLKIEVSGAALRLRTSCARRLAIRRLVDVVSREFSPLAEFSATGVAVLHPSPSMDFGDQFVERLSGLDWPAPATTSRQLNQFTFASPASQALSPSCWQAECRHAVLTRMANALLRTNSCCSVESRLNRFPRRFSSATN